MNTHRLMIIQGDRPLSGVKVRLSSHGTTPLWTDAWTDAQGQLELSEVSGELELEIEVGSDQRVVKTIHVQESGLQVLDVSAPAPSSPLSLVGSYKALIGYVIGKRYRFDAVLGQGGMGVVMLAHDLVLDRRVAIKMLNAELQAHEDLQRIFMAEARSIASLSHPNLVAIHDVTELEGRALIIFEYVEGVDLESIQEKRGALPAPYVVALTRQLTAALEYMHSRKLVHRDIKPANALLRADGCLKVIDFGLTRSLEDLHVRGTSVRGTPAYMAPEQILGEPLSGATDVYQLGASIYELLTGHLPFEQENIAIAHVQATPESPQVWVPELPDELAWLVLDCLAKDPVARPTASAILKRLDLIYPEELAGQALLAQGLPQGDEARLAHARTLSKPYMPPASLGSSRPRSSGPPMTVETTAVEGPSSRASDPGARASGERASSQRAPRALRMTLAVGVLIILGALGALAATLWAQREERQVALSRTQDQAALAGAQVHASAKTQDGASARGDAASSGQQAQGEPAPGDAQVAAQAATQEAAQAATQAAAGQVDREDLKGAASGVSPSSKGAAAASAKGAARSSQRQDASSQDDASLTSPAPQPGERDRALTPAPSDAETKTQTKAPPQEDPQEEPALEPKAQPDAQPVARPAAQPDAQPDAQLDERAQPAPVKKIIRRRVVKPATTATPPRGF